MSLTPEELFLAFVPCRSDSRQILSRFVDLKKAFFHLRVGSRFLQIFFFFQDLTVVVASIVSNEKSVVGLIHAILWVVFFFFF